MVKHVAIFWKSVSIILVTCILSLLVDSQDLTGFISVNCGATTSHVAETQLTYVADTSYINSGESKTVAPRYNPNVLTRFKTLRSFPEGVRNCYTLKPLQAGADKFLIRAEFLYGNFDLANMFPEFDLYVGVNFWATISVSDAGAAYKVEMIHTVIGNAINVCLVHKGIGTPFISVLELRPIDNENYPSTTGSLTLAYRFNMGSDTTDRVRYPDDIYDRMWDSAIWKSGTMGSIETSLTVSPNNYVVPSKVMSTAIVPVNPLQPLEFSLTVNPAEGYYFHLHFAEVETLAKDDFRGFVIYLNNNKSYHAVPIIPPSLSSFTLYSIEAETVENPLIFSLRKTVNSTLPPLLNAIEVYMLENE